MKTRLGFVSNSSSSSFILKINEDEDIMDIPIVTTLRDLLELRDTIDNNEIKSFDFTKSIKDVKKHISGYHRILESGIRELIKYHKFKNLKGKKLIYLDIPNDWGHTLKYILMSRQAFDDERNCTLVDLDQIRADKNGDKEIKDEI